MITIAVGASVIILIIAASIWLLLAQIGGSYTSTITVNESSYAVNITAYGNAFSNWCNITSATVFTSINGTLSSKLIPYGNITNATPESPRSLIVG